MIRMLVAIIFALSILGASAAHAAISMDGFSLIDSTDRTANEQPCQKKLAAAIDSTFLYCPVRHYRAGGQNQCHIDIAPIVNTAAQQPNPCEPTGQFATDQRLRSWIQQPVIGPPRLV
jgi:hypothetical protein